jgi:16S rRNA (uracil1498-N3)-methyltransferase
VTGGLDKRGIFAYFRAVEYHGMNLFYTNQVDGQRAVLPEEEARHCVQVLRHRAGDALHLIDGEGGWYRGTIVEAEKKHCVVQIEEHWEEEAAPAAVHLAVAPTKNISRTEWLLEKATEIGLASFRPLLCAHSERRVIKPARLKKVLLSAAKQSLQARLPELLPMLPFQEFLAQEAVPAPEKYMAYLGQGVKDNLKNNYQVGRDVCILIGPEGGFSPEEARMAKAHGFRWVSLGPSRLRTETAGLVGCHTIHLMNQ